MAEQDAKTYPFILQRKLIILMKLLVIIHLSYHLLFLLLIIYLFNKSLFLVYLQLRIIFLVFAYYDDLSLIGRLNHMMREISVTGDYSPNNLSTLLKDHNLYILYKHHLS